jgi:transposase
MARPLQVTIVESREELERRLDAQITATGKERLLLLYWLKLGIVNSRTDLVKLLHKSEATITRWLSKYKSGGLTALLEVKHAPGNPNSIPTDTVLRLQERLKQPQGFTSYGQVQQWLKQECGVSAAYHTVHSLVRYKLQAKLKKPRPKSRKQNPEALDRFKKTLRQP